MKFKTKIITLIFSLIIICLITSCKTHDFEIECTENNQGYTPGILGEIFTCDWNGHNYVNCSYDLKTNNNFSNRKGNT